MRPLACLALLVVGGCGTKLVDPCAGEPHACVALQLDPSPGISALDAAAITVTTGSGTPLAPHTTMRPNGASFTLPTAVALVFTNQTAGADLSLHITVSGSLRGSVIAVGSGQATVREPQHVTVHITMNASGPASGAGDLAGVGGNAAPDLATGDDDMSAPPPDMVVTTCGAAGQACCPGNVCGSPFVCSSGSCQQKQLTWTAMTSVAGVTGQLNGVWVSAAGNVYAVGASQAIVYSSDGVNWSQQTGPNDGVDLNGVWGRGNGAYTVGNGGELQTTSGSTWNHYGCTTTADMNNLLGITGDAANRLYMWDSAHQIAVYDASTLLCSTLASTALTSITSVFVSGSDVIAVGEAPGVLAQPAIAHSSDGGASFAFDMMPATTGFNSMQAVWGTASGRLYASGGNGLVFRSMIGSHAWTTDDTADAGGNQLLAIWGSDVSGYVYAVGVNGAIVRTIGDGVWHKETSNSSVNLFGVWGSADGSRVYAVGANGTILRGQ